jgi:hypothetical protein
MDQLFQEVSMYLYVYVRVCVFDEDFIELESAFNLCFGPLLLKGICDDFRIYNVMCDA